VVAGLALFLWGLEGVPGRAIFERGEVPHDGGVAGVDLDILHFLFLNYDYNRASPINHLYELPFEFKFLEPSTNLQQGFSLRVCRGAAKGES
jgi:hypothetical protein